MNRSIANAMVALGLVTAATLATAQPVKAPAAGAAKEQNMRRFDERRVFSLPSERIEARLAYIKTALKITDAQQPQWNAFANAARKQAAEQEKRMKDRRARMAGARTGERQRPNAVERLERQQQFLAAASAGVNERLAVEKPLYAALTPEQRSVADVVLAPRGHGRFGGHGMHRNA